MSDHATSPPDPSARLGWGLSTVRQRLRDPRLPERLQAWGFTADDRASALEAADAVADRGEALDAVAELGRRLLTRLGDFTPATDGQSVWAGVQDRESSRGGLALLTLLVTAPEVAAFHAARGVPPAVSTATLADLGQQVAVHRLTYGHFGLHTQGWLALVWSGALYRVGRLQFNLQREAIPGRNGDRPDWVLSTHIPRSGRLAPDEVDTSLAQATALFARCFADYPTRTFHCESWLLDPELSASMPGSNLAAFQQRWHLYGVPKPGDADALLFGFLQPGKVDPAKLPRDTQLQRLLADRLSSGQGWTSRKGWLPQ